LAWGPPTLLASGHGLGVRGWIPGHADDHGVPATARAWEVVGKREIQQLQSAALLAKCLDVLGKALADAQPERKLAPWKVALAAYLKQETAAGNAWLAQPLPIVSANAVSHYVAALRHKPKPAHALLHRLITRIGTCVFFWHPV